MRARKLSELPRLCWPGKAPEVDPDTKTCPPSATATGVGPVDLAGAQLQRPQLSPVGIVGGDESVPSAAAWICTDGSINTRGNVHVAMAVDGQVLGVVVPKRPELARPDDLAGRRIPPHEGVPAALAGALRQREGRPSRRIYRSVGTPGQGGHAAPVAQLVRPDDSLNVGAGPGCSSRRV